MQCKLIIKQKFTIIDTCIIQTEAITAESVSNTTVYWASNGPTGELYKIVTFISVGLSCDIAFS